VTLTDVRDRYELSELTNPAKVRDGRLMRMAAWAIQHDRDQDADATWLRTCGQRANLYQRC
jgi:hypothetical protein